MTAVVIKSEQVRDQKPRIPRQPKIQNLWRGSCSINIAFLDALPVHGIQPQERKTLATKRLSQESCKHLVLAVVWRGFCDGHVQGILTFLKCWLFKRFTQQLHLALLHILTSSLETLHHLVAKEVRNATSLALGHL